MMKRLFIELTMLWINKGNLAMTPNNYHCFFGDFSLHKPVQFAATENENYQINNVKLFVFKYFHITDYISDSNLRRPPRSIYKLLYLRQLLILNSFSAK